MAAVIVPFIFCFWWPKANRAGSLAGIFCGLGGWGFAVLFESIYPADLIGFAVSLLAMILVTLLTQKIDPPRALTDYDGNPLELKDRFGRLGFRT